MAATGAILGGIGAGLSGIGAIAGAVGRRNADAYSPDINPYAGPAWNQMMGTADQMRGAMDQYQQSTFQQDVNQFGDVMQGQGASFINQIMGGTEQAAYDRAGLLAQQNMTQVGGQYGNVGAVQSGAGMYAMARGAAVPYSQAMTDITGMRAQATMGVGSQLWGGLQQTNTRGLQQYQTQAGLLGQTLSSMGQLGNLAAQPQTTYAPYGSPFGSAMSGIGGALSVFGQSFGDDNNYDNQTPTPYNQMGNPYEDGYYNPF